MAPTQIELGQIMAQIDKLPHEDQEQLYQVLTRKLSNGSSQQHDDSGNLKAGWAKELITMGEDFDQPLNDFKEYME